MLNAGLMLACVPLLFISFVAILDVAVVSRRYRLNARDHLKEVGAKMPKPNPNYDPNKEPAKKVVGKGGRKPMRNE